jgi:oligoendopeptidase F
MQDGALMATPSETRAGLRNRPRAEIPEQYTWNLADLYPSVEAWRAAKDRITADVARVGAFAGTLGRSPAALADALDAIALQDKELSRAYIYAGMLADQDTRDSAPQGMRQEMVQLAAVFGAETAFVEPEILSLPPGTVERFVAAEPRLTPYAHQLRDISRRAAHTLSPAEERLLADAGPLAGAPRGIHSILTNADFPYPAITLSTGDEVVLTMANYALHRASPVREDRQAVMTAWFGALGRFGRTLGMMANGTVQKMRFFARARKYGSSLAAALDGPNIPVSVYERLVDGVNRHLPALHRYLRLRQRLLGLDELHYFDLYAPLVSSVALEYTPEEAQAQIVAALAPLGPEYTGVLQRAFAERWVDVYPTPGKRGGAYSNGGAYDVHPYILLNYNGQFDDMSTYAHEFGHTMHSYYSNRTQPYPTAGYATFNAEVASTFNEALLLDHILGTVTDADTRLSLLGHYLENIKQTVFRQTQFAEFEREMHAIAQRGEAVTGDALSQIYMALTKRYYGHDQGICVVDDYVAHEWSYVPHFYMDFYVFQYATSFTAAEALAQKIRAGDADTVERYLRFLGAGGSKYPVELLADAGVDMTTDEPLELTLRTMHRVMDEIEGILASRGKVPGGA